MKKILILLFTIVSFSAFAQKAEKTKPVETLYSPGHYIKLAGSNMIFGETLSIVSAVLIVAGATETSRSYSSSNSRVNALQLTGFAGEIIALGAFISAGVNLHEAGKRMIELKMGVTSSTNTIGVAVNF